MCHEVLTQRALFALIPIQKEHAESAIRDACRTSSDDYGNMQHHMAMPCGHTHNHTHINRLQSKIDR